MIKKYRGKLVDLHKNEKKIMLCAQIKLHWNFIRFVQSIGEVCEKFK